MSSAQDHSPRARGKKSCSPNKNITLASIPQEEKFEDILIKICGDDKGEISIPDLIGKLNHNGFLVCKDLRLRPLVDKLLIKLSGSGDDKYNSYNLKKTIPVTHLTDLPKDCEDIIKKTLFGKALIPEFSRFSDDLLKMYDKVAEIKTGKIPAFLLSENFKDHWGVSVCTTDGQVWSHGDNSIPFTLQSGSLALNYAIAITRLGSEVVHGYVGKEVATNSMINTLDLDQNGVPHNAMTQGGGLAITSLLLKETPNNLPTGYENIVSQYQSLAGDKPLKINNTVYLADKRNCDRKFSIAYLLKEQNSFPPDLKLKNIIDLYFLLNSVEITCEIGAVIASTLANGGVCPTTGKEVLSTTAVQNTLSIMNLQGMYSYSAEWMIQTGLPAKSSSSGMIMVVVPGVMGMCLYSPPLDENGNSVRALEFVRKVSKRFSLHYLDSHIAAPITKENLMHRHEGKESHEQVIMNVMYAAAHGDKNLLDRYCELGLNLDVTDYDYRTALHLACCNDNIDIARYLIERKVNVFALDRWNRTPLDDAKRYGSKKLVELLREHGANEGPGKIQYTEEEEVNQR
ncbi:glutaminase liver isoform, mitochondrial-like [Bolinopsis microptera]|uniref:glutaminase liver isoform, mitochondrial-like n=1 Tax=Bolinopsis microptera TaxID=2820187 RepID=UPI00307985F8